MFQSTYSGLKFDILDVYMWIINAGKYRKIRPGCCQIEEIPHKRIETGIYGVEDCKYMHGIPQ